MPDTITALADGKALRQTRVMPSSATVLAMRWTDEGYTNVRIVADGLTDILDSGSTIGKTDGCSAGMRT